MRNFGPYLRQHIPSIYFFLVTVLNAFKKSVRPYSIYITDSLGGSFKEYFIKSDMTSKISDLKRGLDKESTDIIDVIMQRLTHYPDEKYKHRISKREPIIGGLLPIETEITKSIIEKELKSKRRNLKFPGKHVGESVFYFQHGIRNLPGEVADYIRNHDFIDAGAFIGDSAIALNEHSYKKIFSIEISRKSIEKYKENMAGNNIMPDKYELINAGIAANDQEPPVKTSDTGSSGFSLLRKSGKYDEIFIRKRSIDNIAAEYDISPRFIKVDIEGYGLEFVKGAERTLKAFRPVLSIAVYHNPYEFFEIKPMLEGLLNDYIFMIRKLATGIENNLCHSEIILLGYPKEILTGKEHH